MTALAPDLAASEIDRCNASRGDEHAGHCTRHAVDEHRARRELRPFEGGADEGIVADVELHRNVDATRFVEAVRAQAEVTRSKVERDALRLAPVVAAGVKAQVPAADQAIQAFGGGGHGRHPGSKAQESRKCEKTYG